MGSTNELGMILIRFWQICRGRAYRSWLGRLGRHGGRPTSGGTRHPVVSLYASVSFYDDLVETFSVTFRETFRNTSPCTFCVTFREAMEYGWNLVLEQQQYCVWVSTTLS